MRIGNSLKKRFGISRQNLVYCVKNFIGYHTMVDCRNFIVDSRESMFGIQELYLPKGRHFKYGDLVVIWQRNQS